ncbi:MAG TPA: BON domain-containing protein, partial [Solirubrobacteraceae bacterium]
RRYEDEERFGERRPPERYRGEEYYGGYYQPSRSRGDYGRRPRPDDRGFFDRAGDEVRSWFGDEEAERRRIEDEREARQRGWRYPAREIDRGRDYADERQWARQWGYVDRSERRPMAERGWADDRWPQSAPDERGWPSTREPEWPPVRSGMSGYDRRGSWEAEAWMMRGPHTGKGPKGYQRSDERIREDVCERLCDHGEVDASEIEIRVTNREVTLLGAVGTRAEKRLAEDIVDSVPGVGDVHNQLRVSQDQPGSPSRPDWRNRAA